MRWRSTFGVLALLAACKPDRSDVTVIVAPETPGLGLSCPKDRCNVDSIDHPRCDRATDVVVVSGHSLPPTYLGVSADALASAIACRSPKLVVLDTCWGASLPLLEALVRKGVRARVVGASFYLPERGLAYGDEFWSSTDPDRRAASITSPHATWALTNVELDPSELEHWNTALSALSTSELKARLRHVAPNYVVVGDGRAKHDEVTVEVPPERFR